MSLATEIPGELYTRSEVGMPSTPGGEYRELSAVDRAIWHWTTGRGLGNHDTLKWVKNIYDYHVGSNGWADIGYNYLYDRYGNVFVGRGRYRRGAHAPGANLNGMGIAYLGGEDDDLTADAKRAANALMGWLQQSVTIRVERGHGQVPGNSTSCPGIVQPWIDAGRPSPDPDKPDPDDKQPTDDGTPDLVVAVVVENDIDEGMGWILNAKHRWAVRRFGDLTESVGTAVLIGQAARREDDFAESRIAAGSGRRETAREVAKVAGEDLDSRTAFTDL